MQRDAEQDNYRNNRQDDGSGEVQQEKKIIIK